MHPPDTNSKIQGITQTQIPNITFITFYLFPRQEGKLSCISISCQLIEGVVLLSLSSDIHRTFSSFNSKSEATAA